MPLEVLLFLLRFILQSNCSLVVSVRYHSTTAVSSLWNAFRFQIVGISKKKE
jgi:hypothetical protein